MDWPPDGLEVNTQGFSRYHHLREHLPNPLRNRIRICRCWQSKKFPFCDDTHRQMVEAGDNVGPMILVYKKSAAIPPPAGYNRGSGVLGLGAVAGGFPKVLGLAQAVLIGCCFGVGVAVGKTGMGLHNTTEVAAASAAAAALVSPPEPSSNSDAGAAPSPNFPRGGHGLFRAHQHGWREWLCLNRGSTDTRTTSCSDDDDDDNGGSGYSSGGETTTSGYTTTSDTEEE